MDILLKDLESGQKYIFQARGKNADGQTSPWSTAFSVTTVSDTIAPGPVTSLSWEVEGTAFIGTWVKPTTDSNGKPLKDFRDYKVIVTAGLETAVYFVQQERFDFTLEANRNSFGAPEPTVDISVQARDLTGNLSTAVIDSASNPPPSDIVNFNAEGINQAISLTWDASTDTDFKYYEVYMSTSGSGFTPGPSNIVYTGSSTKFIFSTTNLVTHYFKARAVDVFGQGSNYVSDSAMPDTEIDLTPPDDPTSVTVGSTATDDGYATLEVDWAPVSSPNLSDYVVRYSTDEVAWIYVTVPNSQSAATINGVLPDTDYYVQVAAMSYANVKSNFVHATPYPKTTAADTSAPSQPAAPTVSTAALMAQVSHDMTKQGGGDLESDVIYLEVHASVTTGFTPSLSTLRGTIDTAGPGIDVSGVFYFATTDSLSNLYWKVIAVDRAKNKSTASNQSTGVPGLIANANIANATITSAKIQDLEVNKLIAGTGIINALDVKSTLTIQTGGHIRSSNWNGTDTGWSLDQTGLVIYGGTISAAAILLQDSANIIPPPFADFEFNDVYYHTSGAVNTTVMSTVGTGVTLALTSSSPKFGNKCLRLSNGVITNPTVHDLIFAPSGLSATGVNIDLSPGTYIFSGYFKKNGSVNALLKFGLYPDTGSAITSSASTINSTSWTRFEAQLVVPSGVSKVKAYLEFGPAAANTGYDFLVDGLQIERQMTGATTAGIWRPPSKTTIDGDQIVTGSIRSSAASPTVPTQPAWLISTAGNIQIGDALVRGSIVVGNDASENSYVRSTNYVANTSGWTINANGFAEFSNVTLRGEMTVYDGSSHQIIKVGKNETGDLHPLVRVKHPTADTYLKMFNFDDGGGTSRPSVYFYVNDTTNGVSDGYIWYDQIPSNARGRMRLHVESAIASKSVDLYLVGGDASTDTGYIRVNKEIRFTDPGNANLPEPWHNFGASAGTTANPGFFSNSWANFGGAWQVAGYRLMPDGTVRVRGLVTGGTVTGGTIMATLPTGYRPPADLIFAGGDGTASNQSQEVVVTSSGQIKVGRIGGTGGTHSWQFTFSVT